MQYRKQGQYSLPLILQMNPVFTKRTVLQFTLITIDQPNII